MSIAIDALNRLKEKSAKEKNDGAESVAPSKAEPVQSRPSQPQPAESNTSPQDVKTNTGVKAPEKIDVINMVNGINTVAPILKATMLSDSDTPSKKLGEILKKLKKLFEQCVPAINPDSDKDIINKILISRSIILEFVQSVIVYDRDELLNTSDVTSIINSIITDPSIYTARPDASADFDVSITKAKFFAASHIAFTRYGEKDLDERSRLVNEIWAYANTRLNQMDSVTPEVKGALLSYFPNIIDIIIQTEIKRPVKPGSEVNSDSLYMLINRRFKLYIEVMTDMLRA